MGDAVAAVVLFQGRCDIEGCDSISISESIGSAICRLELMVSCEDCKRDDVGNRYNGFSSSSSDDSIGVTAGVRRGFGIVRGDWE